MYHPDVVRMPFPGLLHETSSDHCQAASLGHSKHFIRRSAWGEARHDFAQLANTPRAMLQLEQLEPNVVTIPDVHNHLQFTLHFVSSIHSLVSCIQNLAPPKQNSSNQQCRKKIETLYDSYCSKHRKSII